MSSAFQPGAFQYNAFQIDPGQIRSPFYAPNPDVRFQGWQWQPQPVNLQLYPPTTRTFLNPWQSVYTWDSGAGLWQGMSPSAAHPIPLLTQQIIYGSGGQVPTKFWRYDYDSGASDKWTWQPPGSDTLDMLVEGGNPFHKFWRYDTDTDVRLWSWQPPPVFPSNFPFVLPFSKLWRYDLVPDPVWQGAPTQNQAVLDIAPFYRLWRYDLDADVRQWSWAAPAAPYNILGGQVPTKFWRYDWDSGGSAWTWQPPGSQTLDMLVEGGTPFHRLWRYDWDNDIRLWQWPGAPTTQAQLGLAINPFFRLWRYDVDTDVRVYNWPPQLSSALFMLVEGGNPFHKLWRYDLDTNSWWQGAPSGSNFNILGGKVPTKFWRWDHVPDPPRHLGPVAAPFNVLGGKVPTKFWRWDYAPEQDWAWLPLNLTATLPTVGPLTPPALFAKFWRYDYDSGASDKWTWLPPPIPPVIIPPVLPTNVVLLQDDDDTWSFYLLVDGTLFHVSAQYASTYPFFQTLIYWPFSYRTALSGPLSNDPPVPVVSTKDPGLMAVWAFRGSISAALVQWAAQQAQTLH